MLLQQLAFDSFDNIEVPESLDLALAPAPVLVFRHALLHRIVELSTASAGYHLVNRVILIVVFTAAVMG
ncbi:hypothetical protein EYF80_039905 [Liparis tanakae]|uniref:Uncharacterized protein n=1 Tax=Liparis tanakae TaxID=230148 RepID=A0A4Z2GA27_9TELE|nr:hypothetical protein EYF80_039905 [Liparis tanakae]